MTEQLEFSVSEEWQKFARENSWASFVLETALDSDGVEYHKKRGSQIAYRRVEDGFKCVECDSEIQAARVAHPIWDGPFQRSGSARCYHEQVPYCPKCEREPNSPGRPIQHQILLV